MNATNSTFSAAANAAPGRPETKDKPLARSRGFGLQTVAILCLQIGLLPPLSRAGEDFVALQGMVEICAGAGQGFQGAVSGLSGNGFAPACLYGAGYTLINTLAIYDGAMFPVTFSTSALGDELDTVGYVLPYGYSGCFNLNVPQFAPGSTQIGLRGRNLHSYAFTIAASAKNINFGWGEPSKQNGGYSFVADGVSQIQPYSLDASVPPTALTWTLTGPPGTTINSGNGIISVGTNSGTVLVAGTYGGTCYVKSLDLSPSCSACSELGCATPANHSVELRVGLGWAAEGGTAGFFEINEAAPSTNLGTPLALHYAFLKGGVYVATNADGSPRQVSAPQTLADVVTNSGTSYSINFYDPTNIVTFTNGLYVLTNSPWKTVSVQLVGGDTNRVEIADDAYLYDYYWQGSAWQLVSGGGLRSETQSTVWALTNSLRTVTTTVAGTNGVTLYETVDTFQTFGFGERLMTNIVGSGAAALTNTYLYTANGFTQQVVRGDGSWAYFVYDSANRPTNIFSSFLNQGVTTNAALCRLRVLDYSTNALGGSTDLGNLKTTIPRLEVSYLLGQEISRTYRVLTLGQDQLFQCVNPGAAWNDASNLVTTTTYFTNGFRCDEPMSVARPDGTVDIFQYNNWADARTNVVLTGHPDGTGTNIDNGTVTTSVYNGLGELTQQSSVDVPSGILTSFQTMEYDSLGHRTNTTYLDGTSVQNSYDCCLLQSSIDRDGTLTSYTYDALKRLLTTTANGVTLSNVLDANGNSLAVVRFGIDGSQIMLEQSAYDLAGRVVLQTNALSGVTTNSYGFDSLGEFVTTNLLPDGGVRIETRAMDGSLMAVSGTAARPLLYAYGVETNAGFQRYFEQEFRLATSGGGVASNEWSKVYSDFVGRPCFTLFPDGNSNQSLFNTEGQLFQTLDPDGVSTLRQYNNKGEQEYTVTDMNQNGSIDFAGSDRITRVVRDVVSDLGTNVVRVRTLVWNSAGTNSFITNRVTETSVDGLTLWSAAFGLTNVSQTVYGANGFRYVTNTAPDGSSTVTTYQYGLLQGEASYDSTGSQLGQTRYGYDAHNRQNVVTDFRNGPVTNVFNNADQIAVTISPFPGGWQAQQVTSNAFDALGRVVQTTLPDGGVVTNQYAPTGDLLAAGGARSYAVLYSYDAQGRVSSMTTFTNYASGGATNAVTAWNYDGQRGWLTNKVYADGSGPGYSYTPAGRLAGRLWVRGITTSYGYTTGGDLATVAYSDGTTPGVTNSFDRRGRKVAVVQNGSTTSIALSDPGLVLGESYSGGILNGLAVTNAYDALLRRSGVGAQGYASSQTAYAYDNASRLSSASDGTYSAGYSYLANSPLVGQMVFQQSSTARLTTAKQYDYLNRLAAIVNSPAGSGQAAVSFAYLYNAANQRTNIALGDPSFWNYQYDYLGQVTNGTRFWVDGTPVAGEQFQYVFDDIGNRRIEWWGGDSSGSNLRSSSNTVNLLNQSTQRSVPGTFDVIGAASSNATVTVNGASPYRKSEFYRQELSVTNTTGPVYLAVTEEAALGTQTNTANGSVFVAASPEPFTYDADGNLLSDGRWNYTWDGENRLVGMTGLTNLPPTGLLQLGFAYDANSRRVKKTVSSWNGSAYAPQSTNLFLYDGWKLIAELDGSDNATIRTYVWGPDLSGSIQGAGGVGGLLVVKPAGADALFAAYDGNGNVAALIDATTGTNVVQYGYGPFGELLQMVPGTNNPCPLRFSTKYDDGETDLLYYGYRFHDPIVGRWLSRDPVEEAGGVNLYGAMGNDLVNNIDPYGLSWVLFDSQAWGQLLYGIFIGGEGPGNANPNSNLALRNATGTGLTPLTDENGNIVRPGNLVPGALFSAGMNLAMLPLGEEEGAYKAAEEALKAAEAAKAARLAKCRQALMNAKPVGSALKGDKYHNAATFMRDIAARGGTYFDIVGADGVTRSLVQLPGTLDGQAGRFEYIIDQTGNLTHQLFVRGGTINGTPIKP